MLLTKMSGAGNTFHIADLRTETHDKVASLAAEGPALARHHCAETLGGADGLILLRTSDRADFAWDFYNSDGSLAEMCGNAARCVSQFVYDLGIEKKEISFVSGAGLIETRIKDSGLVEVLMTKPTGLNKSLEIKTSFGATEGLFVNTGVPHFVFEVNGVSFESLKSQSKELQFHETFAPGKTNVTMIETSRSAEDAPYPAVTFERGVEDYTQACGTGAVAAGIYLISRNLEGFDKYIDIKMPGGLLGVKIGDMYNHAFLLGPVEYMGKIEAKLD